MSLQDQKNRVFLKIVRGIIGQGCIPSVNAGGACMYRGLNGLKCAAGHCITDKEYKASYENQGLCLIIHTETNAVTDLFLKKYKNNDTVKMIVQCQNDHDSHNGLKSETNPQLCWARRMLVTAKEYGVNSPVALAMLETVVALKS